LPEAEAAYALFLEGRLSAIELRCFLDQELPDWLAQLDPVIAPAVRNAEALSARDYLARIARLRALPRSAAPRLDAVDVIASPYRYVLAASSLHCFVWTRAYPSRRLSYVAGEDVLDPQYGECPEDVTADDWKRYFKPVMLTDANGRPMPWLESYMPARNPMRAAGIVRERA
jgi:hypothetical protein